jgi:GH24 family phage-related lysozyme (muramidase)
MFEDLKARLRQHEGVVPHLYLDTLGLVTCGIGHMIPSSDAIAGIEMIRFDGTAATPEEKTAEWRLVKGLKPAMLPPYYEERTTLRVTPRAVDVLQDADVASFQSAIAHLLPGFAQFPEPAQEALLDMAFQLGAGGLMSKFPHLALAAKARDWQACADQCHRAGIQEWRNTATADLFRRAAEVSNAIT